VSAVLEVIKESELRDNGRTYLLRLTKESGRTPYSGMHLFRLELLLNGRIIFDFRTNTYEYTGVMGIDAEKAVQIKFEEWKRDFSKNPSKFIEYSEKIKKQQEKLYKRKGKTYFDALIIQGSPRPDGNCAVFASWAVETLNSLGKSSYVLYPDETQIHPCIGCYQCYNYGLCVFRDDMDEITDLILNASVVIVCSPVYTNTVPGSLKIIFDRFMAHHAFCSLYDYKNNRKGLLFSSAGRKGVSNFDSLAPVCDAFMDIAGIRKEGAILCDNMDETGDIRKIKGLREKADLMIRKLFI